MTLRTRVERLERLLGQEGEESVEALLERMMLRSLARRLDLQRDVRRPENERRLEVERGEGAETGAEELEIPRLTADMEKLLDSDTAAQREADQRRFEELRHKGLVSGLNASDGCAFVPFEKRLERRGARIRAKIERRTPTNADEPPLREPSGA